VPKSGNPDFGARRAHTGLPGQTGNDTGENAPITTRPRTSGRAMR